MKDIETERLILRKFIPADAEGIFELDSNPEVHRYLGNNPIQQIEQAREVISMIRQQYIDNGIGRWAVIEKRSGKFIGWSGLKFIREHENGSVNIYDVGYRFIQQYWGKGYATESAKAAIQYGFEQMEINEIYASAHIDNKASRNALQKCGLTQIGQYERDGIPCVWMKMTKEEWLNQQNKNENNNNIN